MTSRPRCRGPLSILILTSLGLLTLPPVEAAPAEPEWMRYLKQGDTDLLPFAHGLPAEPLPQIVPADDPRLDYDVLRYDLSFEPDFENLRLKGETRLTLTPVVTGLQEIVLDLADEMEVQEAWRDSAGSVFSIEFLHANDQVTLLLPRLAGLQDTLLLGISYEGTPGGSFEHTFFGSHASGPIGASLSEPASAHTWWACKDLWADKATVTVTVTAPPGFVGISNGNLERETPGLGGEINTVWETQYPIATYLVAIAITNYVSWETLYLGEDGGIMPLVFYAYPEDSAKAREAWTEPTREAMTIFENLFGIYPFRRNDVEKYGTAEFHWTTGAEEHQTLTSFGSGLIDSLHSHDWVVAHELAHQWFGDAVTPDAFHETWTKEGVATYCEAIYLEQREILRGNTAEAARDSMMMHMEQRRWPERFDQEIMGNPENAYYYPTIYARGSWVFHMLRRIMGDEDFFTALTTFMEKHLYGNAGTEELVETAEEVYGGWLGWFFDPWVYTNARPHISYDWTSRPAGNGLREVHLYLEQTQLAQPFRLLLDVAILGDTEVQEEAIWLEGRWQDFTFQTSFIPQEVRLDPDRWLLAEFAPFPASSRVALQTPAPNPTVGGTRTTIRYRIPSAGNATLDLVDVTGRRVGTLVSGSMPGGWQIFDWNGLVDGGRLASGVYWLRLRHAGITASEKIIILQ